MQKKLLLIHNIIIKPQIMAVVNKNVNSIIKQWCFDNVNVV
jgi:hypothetical protein